jgi:hypothetical protein
MRLLILKLVGHGNLRCQALANRLQRAVVYAGGKPIQRYCYFKWPYPLFPVKDNAYVPAQVIAQLQAHPAGLGHVAAQAYRPGGGVRDGQQLRSSGRHRSACGRHARWPGP